MRSFFKSIDSYPPAIFAGAAAGMISIGLLFFNPFYAVFPLSFFLLSCLIMPFVPRYGFFLPVISAGNKKDNSVVLTFDDGPDPETSLKLLDILLKYDIKATFFITGKKAKRFPEIVRKIIENGHEIGNHTHCHDNFLMLRSGKRIKADIEKAQSTIREFGIEPYFFRPPVGITNPKLGPILADLRLECVNFSCCARDWGNRRIRYLSKKILRKVKSGDIIMLHDVSPRSSSKIASWTSQVESIIDGIRQKGLRIVSLSEMVNHRMRKKTEKNHHGVRYNHGKMARL